MDTGIEYHKISLDSNKRLLAQLELSEALSQDLTEIDTKLSAS
jgi:hypothetical protein